MRRITDGVKVSERWRTTNGRARRCRRARIPVPLFRRRGLPLREPITYEQIAVAEDVIGDQKAFLQDGGMKVFMKTFEGVACSIELPARVTLEIVETEPVEGPDGFVLRSRPRAVQRRQDHGAAPYRRAGTRVVVMTEDASYVERARTGRAQAGDPERRFRIEIARPLRSAPNAKVPPWSSLWRPGRRP